MALVLNEEQRLLQGTAREFLASHAPVTGLRKLRDERDATGFDPALWQTMVELGWASIILPQEHGGLDFGFTGMGVILEECGRTLAASPLFATAVVGASALLLGGSREQQASLLPAIAAGELTLALALEETNHHNPLHIETTLSPEGNHYRLSGSKTFVVDGHSADKLVVVARSAGEVREESGLTLVLVEREAKGIVCERTTLMDSRNAANLRFEAVSIDASQLIGETGAGWSILEPALDRARVAIAAETMGCALEAFERTVSYLKQREQFGVPIGSFQALQHRAALLQADVELCRSVLLQALDAVDSSPQQLPMLASLAKARVNDLALRVTNEAVQMHGGIGVTDELEIGFFLKRARVAVQMFGDTGFHRDRYATLSGY